jgi:hypothetical protein
VSQTERLREFRRISGVSGCLGLGMTRTAVGKIVIDTLQCTRYSRYTISHGSSGNRAERVAALLPTG